MLWTYESHKYVYTSVAMYGDAEWVWMMYEQMLWQSWHSNIDHIKVSSPAL